ncbi:unnamed protein product [Caenorhabditis angaria]|uniref:Uncharacterized protein n=1 Tax=Caenorhabditis angaria TaxID=860376 RepID=A0A9P1I8U6_9PELO|nr:unnamed protein product [Caenorhabditis angaria]
MWKIIIICLCFVAVHSNSDGEVMNILSASDTSLDPEITEFRKSCISKREFIELNGNITGYILTLSFSGNLVNSAVHLMAFSEMRAALGLPPPGPWKHYKKRSKEEFASATPEEYFEFKEERKRLSLDSDDFFEKNLTPVITFLDERFPAIRKMFKDRFNNIHRANPIDRKTVDAITNEYFQNIRSEMDLFQPILFRGMFCLISVQVPKKLRSDNAQ